VTGPDCEEGVIRDSILIDSGSIAIGRDEHGNLVAEENGEQVTDPARTVEIYAMFGGAMGWRIMEIADPEAPK
jgi:hypothetical protein